MQFTPLRSGKSVDAPETVPSRINVQTLVEDPKSNETSHEYVVMNEPLQGSVHCRLCQGDVLTHTPSEAIYRRCYDVGTYLDMLVKKNRLDILVEKIVALGNKTYKTDPSDARTLVQSAALPVCKRGELPIRSSAGILKVKSGREWREEIPLDSSSIKRGSISATDHASCIDSLRSEFADDLGKIILHHPLISYDTVRRHVPRSLSGKNLLQRWMINRVNQEHAAAREICSARSSTKVDIRRIYERYCQNRDPPSDSVVAASSCIGMEISLNYQTNSPSYISLFLWPWGQWICPVDPVVDKDYINRATLLEIFTKAALHSIPVVHSEPGVVCLLSRVFEKISPDACVPDFVQIRDLVDLQSTNLSSLVWKYFGIDIISWNVYMDLARLTEPIPKNPIFASYFPAWKLRWEQMAKMGCDALSRACLFEHFIRLVCFRLQQKQ
jgi:hypothetical protein